MDTKLAEQMAIMVLRGEYAAARGLADWLCETVDTVKVEPVVKIDVPLSRLRVVAFVRPDVSSTEDDERALSRDIRDWLNTPNRPLILLGVESMQIYQLPE